ncbi:sorbosone dehydrogenase [Aureimonas endophytica]|uniref:Sorbosone dehydrogenase n=1 Tax=Aureimonas endophytica TaxID=2027858 RepID=A0A916ZL37_9HYPH|nr:sorbosone dehydrogenase family protein [Aureimonas endophytica]GGE01485.1 sorbosone dehydrogenase [Aureimonas endophytica]
MSDSRPLPFALRASAVTVLLALGACNGSNEFDASQQIGTDPVLPEPEQSLLPDLKVAEVVGWSGDAKPSVPDGLAVSAYATDLANPRTVYTLPNGDVLVVQSRGPGGEPVSRPKDLIRGWIMSIAHGGGDKPQKESNLVTLLRDTNRDGKVDERHDILTKLSSPFGLAWFDDTLYVAATDGVLAYPYRLGETAITAAPRLLTPLPGGPIDHHWTKDLALSPDGRFLYASVGSNSNIVENGLEAEKGRAAIWQIDRQTGAARVYASGLRNPNGLTFRPGTNTLYAVVNERDELGPNLVPDYMTSVKDGAFYGWPWSYYGTHVDARVHPSRPDMVERAIAPDYALSSHVAALGLAFSQGSALPEPFADGAFIGEHGSWNRNTYNGYKVVFVPFQDGKPSGKAEDVVTGFIDGDKAHGRPVGVGIDGTGALLVADDAGNTVWRVASADGRVSPRPIGSDPVQGTHAAATITSPAPATPASSSPRTEGSNAVPSPSVDEQLTGQEPSTPSSTSTSSEPGQGDIAPAVSSPAVQPPASP